MQEDFPSVEITAETSLTLTGGEIATLIEATVDALYKRLQWSVRRESVWRTLPIAYAGQMVRDLEQAHAKLYIAFREFGHLHDEFEKAFIIPDPVYDLIDSIKDATSWDEIEPHLHAPSLCKVCKVIHRSP